LSSAGSQDGRIHIELINEPFLCELRGRGGGSREGLREGPARRSAVLAQAMIKRKTLELPPEMARRTSARVKARGKKK
jgi:hypothetical protein